MGVQTAATFAYYVHAIKVTQLGTSVTVSVPRAAREPAVALCHERLDTDGVERDVFMLCLLECERAALFWDVILCVLHLSWTDEP
jgi:hypothetical protein